MDVILCYRWTLSQAKKDVADDSIAKYDGGYCFKCYIIQKGILCPFVILERVREEKLLQNSVYTCLLLMRFTFRKRSFESWIGMSKYLCLDTVLFQANGK